VKSLLAIVAKSHCCTSQGIVAVTDGKRDDGHLYIFRWSFLRKLCTKKLLKSVGFYRVVKNRDVYFLRHTVWP